MSSPALGADSVPRLGAGFRFQWEAAQNCHVLLYPEGMVKLNQAAGEILKRCDGHSPLHEIIRSLEQAFQRSDLEQDVQQFLTLARQQRWVSWD